MNIFELSTRKKYRFPSSKGDLTIEQLWDLPLRSARTAADLDTIARSVNAELKSVTEESFVQIRPDPHKGELTTKLDVVKHIIAVKLAEADIAKKTVIRADKRRKLLEILAAKADEALGAKSEAELLKELEELDSE